MGMKYIYPYKMGSKSARDLARALGAKRIKHNGSKFKGSYQKIVINWGAPEVPYQVEKSYIINPPYAVSDAGNKLRSFDKMVIEEVPIPEYTTEFEKAREWVLEGESVLSRTLLRANGGRGISICSSPNEPIARAPLYVKYQKSKSEWRVHVAFNAVIITDRKIRNPALPADGVDYRIRNHGNGFIFQRTNEHIPDAVEVAALKAVDALRLHFGAVDVIYNEHYDKAYVLEVNTAPGLTGQTLDKYVKVFEKLY
jgi:hypothetical protein